MATLSSIFRKKETPALELARKEFASKKASFEVLPEVLQISEIEAAERRWNYWLSEIG